MSHHDSQTYWSTTFLERLQSLPQNGNVLTGELCEVSRAYEVFCTDLNERLETLRRHPSPHFTSPSSLPSEILLLIFTFLSQEEPLGNLIGCTGTETECDSENGDRNSDLDEGSDDVEASCDSGPVYHSELHGFCLASGLGWSRVSHVCSHWRAVAIGNATLWTTISLNICTPWLDEIVSRSKCLPLDISIPCDANWDAAVKILSDCLPSVRSIDAERGTDVVNTSISNRSAPLLEHLDIELNTGNSHPISLPDDLAASFPRLAHLSLASTSFLPNLRGFTPSQITHLALISIANIPSTNGLRDMLLSLGGVQYLHLENCLPLGPEDISPNPIDLPHLETFILGGQTSSCGALMRSIEYPSSASTTLYMAPDEPPITDVHAYMHHSGLGVLLDNTASPIFHSLHMTCAYTGQNTWQLVVIGQHDPRDISDYTLERTHARSELTGPSFRDLKIVCVLNAHNTPYSLVVALFEQLMLHLPLSSASALSLNVDDFLSLDTDPWNCARWLSALKDASKVEHLQLISSQRQTLGPNERAQPSPYVDLLLALSLSPSGYGVAPHTILPDLKEISLVNIDAAATALLEGGPVGSSAMKISAAQALRFFVRGRLSFAECNIRAIYSSTAWRTRYLDTIECAPGPLEEMGREMQDEKDRESVHKMIKRRVTKLFPPSNNAT